MGTYYLLLFYEISSIHVRVKRTSKDQGLGRCKGVKRGLRRKRTD